jgi:protein-tyrosine-phosphatase
VLFACNFNSARSPMAAGLARQLLGKSIYVASAGVQKAGHADPFAVAAMEELGIDISRHRPLTFEEFEDLEGLNVDLIVTLTPAAHHRAMDLTRTLAVGVEYWPMPDPTIAIGSREQIMAAYRDLYVRLETRIARRFLSRPAQ